LKNINKNGTKKRSIMKNDKHGTLFFFFIEIVIARIITTTQHVMIVSSQNEHFSFYIYTSSEHKSEGSMKQNELR